MIEFLDTQPDVSVAAADYARLLGYPPGWILDGRAAELAGHAREWYAGRGRPWVYVRQAEALDAGSMSVHMGGAPFTAGRLRAAAERTDAHTVVLVAVSAGPEPEADASGSWHAGKPDEFFVLHVYGSAVVNHLMASAGARLCAGADEHAIAVLPHDSPGYPAWNVGEHASLLELLKRTRNRSWPGDIDALESGALRPTTSQLAVFGLTRHAERLRSQAGTLPCEDCPFEPCSYRRAPYGQRCRHRATDSPPEVLAAADGEAQERGRDTHEGTTA